MKKKIYFFQVFYCLVRWRSKHWSSTMYCCLEPVFVLCLPVSILWVESRPSYLTQLQPTALVDMLKGSMEMDIGGKPRPPSHIPLNFAVSPKKHEGQVTTLWSFLSLGGIQSWKFNSNNKIEIKTLESGIFKIWFAFFTFLIFFIPPNLNDYFLIDWLRDSHVF